MYKKPEIIDNYSVFKSLATIINDLSIKTRLLICFILFSVILISSVGIISYSKSSKTIDEQSMLYSDTVLSQVFDRIEKLKAEIMSISIPLLINPVMQNNDFENISNIEFMQKKRQIESEFNTIMSIKKDISSIYMCVKPDIIISPNSWDIKDEKHFVDYDVYRKCIEIVSTPVWTGAHENEFASDNSRYVLTFSRSFYDMDKFTPFGALIINIPVDILAEICRSGRQDSGYNIFIVNKDGYTIYNSEGKTGSEPVGRAYINNIISKNRIRDSFNYKYGKENYLVKYTHSEDGNWIYIAEIPINYLLENSSQLKRYIFAVLILSFIMSIAAAYLISAYFTNPFRRLINTMKKVEKGNFEVRTGIESKSEMGMLSSSFDHMISEIKSLIQDLDREHTLKREAELNTLQAQITPHFLYNSLNVIKCLARIHKVNAIEEVTASLVELLQLSISKNTKYIRIGEEIEMVKKYLALQGFRCGNKFSVTYECEEEVLGYVTLKMILQPLVENSIYHGVEPLSGGGLIKIRAYQKNRVIYLEVEDNGVGMSEEQIERILNGDNISRRRFSGIGVKNVNERIKMHFGKKYGLSYKSEQGKFTTAVIAVPVIRESEVKDDV